MNTDINRIKRKLLIKYPTFGSVIANLEFRGSFDIATGGTDGKILFYNPKFLDTLSEKQQMFVLAHEVCHVAFNHIFRMEGKDKRLWNIATDAVVNALLQKDGLEMPTTTIEVDGESKTVKDGIDIPEAINYDAEEMYNKLLEDKKKQEQQSKPENQGQQGEQNEQGQQDSQSQENSQENQGEQNSQSEKEETEIENDMHSLWDKAIEERKKEQQDSQSQENSQENQGGQNSQSEKEETKIENDTHSLGDKAIEETKKEQEGQTKDKEKKERMEAKKQEEQAEKEIEEKSKLEKQGERKTFQQNEIERKKKLKELSKELASQSSHEAGDGIERNGKRLSDIGIAKPLIDWRKLLRQAIKYNEDYTRKNARMRNGYFKHKLEQIPLPEAEIVLDTSGSVSETLLKNFLRECKNILDNSKVRVGCFNTEFHGFTEIRKTEDIDNMSFPIGGGTDFDVAVGAFSRKVPNKIIFTDGEASMPKETVRNVIWVIFGNEKINPKGGKVINITGDQLRRLYQSFLQDKADITR